MVVMHVFPEVATPISCSIFGVPCHLWWAVKRVHRNPLQSNTANSPSNNQEAWSGHVLQACISSKWKVCSILCAAAITESYSAASDIDRQAQLHGLLTTFRKNE